MNADSRRARTVRGLSIALAVAAPLLTDAALAQDKFFGDYEFATSCAVCHGTDAHGNGPMASQLTPKPSNLTRLSADNGGEFPYERVLAMIDGRGALAAHGTGVMPIWGDRYSLEAKQPIVHARILELVYYLREIQEE